MKLETYIGKKVGELVLEEVMDIERVIKSKIPVNTGKSRESTEFYYDRDKVIEGAITIYIKYVYPNHLKAVMEGAKRISRKGDGGFISALTAWAKSKLSLEESKARSFAFAYLKYRVKNEYVPKDKFIVSEYIESRLKALESDVRKLLKSEIRWQRI